MQLSGNKVRKLEFLMADAIAQGADSIITIGGIQSNHCRATAVAAKYLNLDCFLILRTSDLLVDQDPGLTGNLLVERMVGAHVHLISKQEYAKIGSVVCLVLLHYFFFSVSYIIIIIIIVILLLLLIIYLFIFFLDTHQCPKRKIDQGREEAICYTRWRIKLFGNMVSLTISLINCLLSQISYEIIFSLA